MLYILSFSAPLDTYFKQGARKHLLLGVETLQSTPHKKGHRAPEALIASWSIVMLQQQNHFDGQEKFSMPFSGHERHPDFSKYYFNARDAYKQRINASWSELFI